MSRGPSCSLPVPGQRALPVLALLGLLLSGLPAAGQTAPPGAPLPAPLRPEGEAAGDEQQRGGATLAGYFQQGNEAYHQGRYDEAVVAYRKATRYGVRDADLEYNLANALLQGGKVGEAILHYERALRLEPRSRDVEHNLALAGRRIQGGAVLQLVRRGIKVGEGTDAGWVAFFRTLTRNEAALVLLVLDVLAFGLLLLRRRHPAGSSARTILAWSGSVFLALALLAGSYCAGQAYIERNVQLGVVLQPTPVRDGPSAEAQVLFQAPEGLKVRLEPSPMEGWRSIRINEELRGFAPAGLVQPIEPF